MVESEFQLPIKVHEYLAGKISLEELEVWIAPYVPVLYSFPVSKRLLGAIELGLAEIDAGIISEDVFRERLLESEDCTTTFVSCTNKSYWINP